MYWLFIIMQFGKLNKPNFQSSIFIFACYKNNHHYTLAQVYQSQQVQYNHPYSHGHFHKKQCNYGLHNHSWNKHHFGIDIQSWLVHRQKSPYHHLQHLQKSKLLGSHNVHTEELKSNVFLRKIRIKRNNILGNP